MPTSFKNRGNYSMSQSRCLKGYKFWWILFFFTIHISTMKRVSPPSSDNIDSMESCAIKRHKNFEDFMLLLECTVCQKSLRPDDDFHSCENSHLICFNCEISLKKTNRVYALKCATCRILWRPCKQLFVKVYLEAAFEGKNLNCPNKPCPVKGNWKYLIGHKPLSFF